MSKIGDQLWLKIVIGLVLGSITGVLLGPDFDLIPRSTAKDLANWLALPGTLFIDLIRFIVIPLVISSVALGIAGAGDAHNVRWLGIATLGFMTVMIVISASLSIVITSLLSPGAFFDKTVSQDISLVSVPDPAVAFQDIPSTITNLIPSNPVAVMAQGNMLGIIVAAGIFGIALLFMKKEEAAPLCHLLDSVQKASLIVVTFIMKFAPIAVFGLIAKVTISSGLGMLGGLGAYIGTFLVILLSILLIYGAIVALLGRNPIDFALKIRDPFIMAFSTSSSSATMPLTLQTADNKLDLHPAVSRMVIPLGTTINMDGTAAYQACVVVFLAQVFGIELTASQMVMLVMLSLTASIGAPGTPGGVLPILVGILSEFGIPPEGFAIVLAVDRILDMSRTTVNVTGDLVTCVFVQKVSGLVVSKRDGVNS